LGVSYASGAELVWHVSFQSGNYSGSPGGEFLDAIGSNNIDPNPDPSFTDGYWHLDGSSDYGLVGDVLDGYMCGADKKWTLEIRAKRDVTGSVAYGLLGKYYASTTFTGERQFFLDIGRLINNEIRFAWWADFHPVRQIIRTGAAWNDTNWHILKIQFDSTATLNEKVRILFDGSGLTLNITNDAGMDDGSYMNNTPTDMVIGNTGYDSSGALYSSYYFDGQIDYAKLYNGIV
jgi:hypothetical protein